MGQGNRRYRRERVGEAIERLAPKEAQDFTVEQGENHIGQKRVVKIRYRPIAWGIPMDEILFSKWFTNFTGLSAMPWDTYITAVSTYLPDARNIIHGDFCQVAKINPDVEHLVMLDSDVLPPLDFLERLLAHKLPMVGGWYHKKGEPYNPVVYDYEKWNEEKNVHQYKIREKEGTGLEKVDAAGAGCWLIHKDVALAIGEKPYSMEKGGEDLELCRKVHEAGFDTWIDWSVACAHAGVAIA